MQHYSDVETRWSTARPVEPDDSTPPVPTEDPGSRTFTHLPITRGARQERSDFTSNQQPGSSPFQGPSGPPVRNGLDVGSSADPLRGGNFCDEGSPSSRCVVSQPLRFPGNYTLSGREAVPFAITRECACAGAGCRCLAAFRDFLPTWATLSWARLTAEAERGGEGKSWASAKVDGLLLQGRCPVPASCDGPPPHGAGGACAPACGRYSPCLHEVDVTDAAADGAVGVEVLDGGGGDPAADCGGRAVSARVRLEGEYTVWGALDVKPGGGLFCERPNCTLAIRDYRWVNVHAGAAVAAERVEIRAAALTVAGTVSALSMEIVAGAVAVNRTGRLVTSDRKARAAPRRCARARMRTY
jgi:hypothetical protein